MKNILLVFAILACSSVYAQQQKGDLSLQFSASYFSQKVRYQSYDFKFGAGTLSMKIGKYFTQNLELGVKPNITFSFFTAPPITSGTDKKEAETTTTTNVGFGIYGAYSFLMPNGKFLPFCGAELAYAPSGKEQTINLGPYGGVKYFLTERVNIDGNVSWLINLGSTYEESRAMSNIRPMFNFNIGIGVLLGKLTD